MATVRYLVARPRLLPTLTLVALYCLVIAGSALRFRETFLHNPMDALYSDPGRHWEHARQTLTPSLWAFLDPPIFQMWVSLVQKWSLGWPPLVAVYAGAMSVATPFAWYCFLRETLQNRTLAAVGWAAFVWLPSWIAIYSYFMTETLFLPLMGMSLWQTIRAERERSVASFCGMVVLWTVTGLTRGIAVPLGGLAGLWVWLRHPRKLSTAIFSIAIVAAIAVPIAVRNYRAINLWSPLGSGWPSQIYTDSGARDIHLDIVRDGETWNYGFGSPSLFAKQLAPLSDWDSKRAGTIKVSIDVRKGSADWLSAHDANAVRGWKKQLWLRWENLVFIMLGRSWPDDNPASLGARAALATRWVWAPLFVVVMGLAVRFYRGTLRRPLLPLLIATWFVFQAVSLLAINEGRYRKPLEGLLIAQVLVFVDDERLLAWRPSFITRLRGKWGLRVWPRLAPMSRERSRFPMAAIRLDKVTSFTERSRQCEPLAPSRWSRRAASACCLSPGRPDGSRIDF